MRLRPSSPIAALLALAVLAAVPAWGGQWQKLAAGKGEKVEVDLSRLTVTDSGRIQAWSRLLLAKPVGDEESGTTYDRLEVLNSYDCGKGRYAPVKRLYLDGEVLLKDEPIYGAKEQSAGAGVDGALLKAVCRSQPAAARTAKTAKTVPDAGKPFGVMHAELVTDGKDAKTRTVAVADKAEGPTKRIIDMPRIDPSQVEKPTDIKPDGAKAGDKPAEKSTAEKATAKPAEKSAEKPADKPADKPQEKSPPAAKLDAADKAVDKSRPNSVDILNGLDKRVRELALATTGPRRVVKKKAAPEPKHEIHWSYEGDGGPENWARIDPKNALCAGGQRQSPINIEGGVKVDLEPLRFDYRPQRVRIEDNGHTVQVNVAEGNTLRVMGRTYELKQFHFHRPSEEKVAGKRFDMVVHLVHQDDEGHLAVVAVLLERGESEQPVVQSVWNNLPLETGPAASVFPATPLDVAKLFPADRSYYTYMGSLTTPPCSEGVLWLVFKQPVLVTPEQIAVFSRLYRNNARPVQPDNGRLIKESR